MPSSKNSPYRRLQLIDACLRNKFKTYPSKKDLLDYINRSVSKPVSEETLLKDIAALKTDYNAPIKYSKSRNGYYYSEEFTFDSIPLTQDEIDTLRDMLGMLELFKGNRISENFTHAVEKIISAYAEAAPAKKERVQLVKADNAPRHRGFEYFEFFISAARKKIPVNFVHYSYEHRKFNSVIFHPAFLKEFQNNWYVVGFSENHKEVRIFGLDRIFDPLPLNREYIAMTEESKEHFFRDMYGVYAIGKKKKERVILEVSSRLSDLLIARPLHPSQKLVNSFDSGKRHISFELILTQEFLNFILSYVRHIKVLTPSSLKEKVIMISKLNVNNDHWPNLSL